MRNAFASVMTELARARTDLMLLSGDIGNRLFDDFKEIAPERFLNCGVAEGNMMSVAAGLGLSGFRPFVYTITPFLTSRCHEQIKIDVCYHNSPVTIVGTGSGLSYAALGPTHHSLEDIAILRALPNMRIFCPCDSVELKACVEEAIKLPLPAYIRIGKKGEKQIHTSLEQHSIIRPSKIFTGSKIAVLCCGTLMEETIEAIKLANEQDIFPSLYSSPVVKPLNENFIHEINGNYDTLIAIEEHSKIGGFGEALSSLITKNQYKIKLISIGVEDVFIKDLGSQEYVRKKQGLDRETISNIIIKQAV